MGSAKAELYLQTFSFGCNNKLKYREPIYDFAATIGEIIADMPYLCEPRIMRAKRAISLFFPPFEDKLRLKTLNLQFSAKKQVNF